LDTFLIFELTLLFIHDLPLSILGIPAAFEAIRAPPGPPAYTQKMKFRQLKWPATETPLPDPCPLCISGL
jgi:hypothetical protein